MGNQNTKDNCGSGCCSSNDIKQEKASSYECGCSQNESSCCSSKSVIITVILVVLIASAIWIF